MSSIRDKKRYLRQYLELKREVEKEADDMGYWKDKAYSVGTPNPFNFGIHSANRFSPIDKFLELAERCAKRGEIMENKKSEIVGAIDCVDDPLYRTVLKEKYIRGKTLGEVARETHYSLNYVKHLHIKALKIFEIPKDDTF